uniref:NACHT, LRR and PYD domains-containing protein 12-like n=1 Tax=Poecilia reticulata TaxID=8081 RepID=A0A3P9PN18_POERE
MSNRMDKVDILTRILKTENTSTILSGQSPASVINSRKYVPVTADAQDDNLGFLDDAIRTALCGETRTVVVVGPEGSGKTTALLKLVVDWANGECLQNFSHVFNFHFRKIGSSTDELCLETLIQQGHHQMPPNFTRLVTEEPDGVLFVFDGLDEFKHSLDPSVHTLTSNLYHLVSVSCLLASLLHGSLLKGAAFLVATRPTDGAKFLSGIRMDVLGFQKPQREVYFNDFFPDPTAASEAFLHIERTLGIYDFCASPRFCWTVCSIYKRLIDSCTKPSETLSQLFVDILVHLIQTLSLNKERSRGLVLALGRMASHCLYDQHSGCSKHTIDSFGFEHSLTSVDGFLRVHSEGELSFHSKLMQEFVLAVAFFLDPSTHGDTEKMLDNHKGCSKFLDFFMSGLSEPVQYRLLEDLLGMFRSDQIKGFKSWFKSRSEKTLKKYDKSEHYRCFHLLHQAQNQSLVKEILNPAAHSYIFHENLSLQDCAALNYVITCPGEREKLSVSRTTILREMMEVLAPSVSLSHTVILSNCSIHKDSIPLLASAVSMGVTRELELSHSNLGDEKLQILCAGLREAKLHGLNLNVYGLTAACCGYLASLLTLGASQLQILQMMFNPIGNQGFTKLCKAMHSPNCRLQEIQSCNLTAASMKAFASALCSGQSQLTTIDFKGNMTGDGGIELISAVCYVSLFNCFNYFNFSCFLLLKLFSTFSCISAAVILQICILTTVSLGTAIFLVCKYSLNCPVFALCICSLTRCELTTAVFEKLGSVLKNGICQIKSLLLAINKVGDQGVKYLWDALAHPNCLLEELSVEMTKLTDACVEDLCAAVRASHTLKRQLEADGTAHSLKERSNTTITAFIALLSIKLWDV